MLLPWVHLVSIYKDFLVTHLNFLVSNAGTYLGITYKRTSDQILNILQSFPSWPGMHQMQSRRSCG